MYINTKKSAKVVIGANYGDEGKGLMTDYFAGQEGKNLVVRFNGGCQAGHTVTTPDGRRHVFSHIGSGTFSGAATYLSRHYAINPVLYIKELGKLLPVTGQRPTVYVDDRAPVTTFFDMLVNQIIEDQRGNNRHGSCGMGFGETIGRQEEKLFPLTVLDLLDESDLRRKLVKIRDCHLPARCKTLGITTLGQHSELCTSDILIDEFIKSTKEFLDQVTLVSSLKQLNEFKNIVFEGAQGLLLDQHRGAFPHVTRSNTGVFNALEIAEEAGISSLEITYVTRNYLTRHGAGPLTSELPCQPYTKIVDKTNQPNEYQGSLRFAYLNHDLLANSIQEDWKDTLGKSVTCSAKLAVTCLDQVDKFSHYWTEGELKKEYPETHVATLHATVLPVGFCSYGPTRNDVQEKSSFQK